MYNKLFKEGNGYHKFLMCPDLRDNNFEVLCSVITLDEINLYCAENVKTKFTGNNSVFITYSNKINLVSEWLDNTDFILTQWPKKKDRPSHGSKNQEEPKK